MNIQGFAIDLDGTLTNELGLLNLDATLTLRYLEKMGYNVLLVSGRSVWEIFHTATLIGTTKVVVSENGGVIATSPTDLIVLGNKNDSLLAYDFLVRVIDDVKLKSVVPRLTEVILERTFELDYANKLLEDEGIQVCINDSKFSYHLTNKGINKATGLIKASEYLGIDLSNVVAIGDSKTDIPMFETCGYSIVIGDSSEEIKAKASKSISGNGDDDLMDAIQHVAEKFMKISLNG